MMTIVYEIDNKIYINMTNKCPNNCSFCIRNTSDGISDYKLWLDREPTVQEVIDKLQNIEQYVEAVFCGFGEPLCRLEDLIEVAKFIKSRGVRTRINTNGQASLIYGEGVAEKFVGVIDVVNISLNASNSTAYQDICESIYGEEAFDSLLQFASDLVGKVPVIKFSVVDTIGEEEIAKCSKLAEEIGVELRVRHYQVK